MGYDRAMLGKYGKQTHDFWGIFIFSLVYFSIDYILGVFLIKQFSFPTCWIRDWLKPTHIECTLME